MDFITFVFIIVLVISIVFHEVAHGFMANLLGDPTAKLQGRLTLNPIKHIDMVGSVIVPAFLLLTNSSILFGWAKPVPYNPYNLKKGGRFAEALVALAGPLTNLALALFTVLIFKIGLASPQIAFMAVYMNIFLAFLNLLPLPPLDGSKILPAVLPQTLHMKLNHYMRAVESGGITTLLVVLIVLTLFVARPLADFVGFLSMLFLSL